MSGDETGAMSADIFGQLRSLSQRFISPAEFNRFVNNCASGSETIFIFEYECVLVEPGGQTMDPLWIEAIRRAAMIGIKFHVISLKSPEDIAAAVGHDTFHQVYQCRSEEEKMATVRFIRVSAQGANVVCCATEFINDVRGFTDQDFVYFIRSSGLPPWTIGGSGLPLLPRFSTPINIHREYVICMISMAFLFRATIAADTHNAV
jgi:hypothetical protein